MAVDFERLVVSLEAKITSFEKNLAKAGLLTDKEMGRIERRIQKTESTFANFGRRFTAGWALLQVLRPVFKQLDDGTTESAAKVRALEEAWKHFVGWIVQGAHTITDEMFAWVNAILPKLDEFDKWLAQSPFIKYLQSIGMITGDPNHPLFGQSVGEVFGTGPGLRLTINRRDPAQKVQKAAKKEAPDILGETSASKTIANLQEEEEQLSRTSREQAIYNQLNRAGVDIKSEEGQIIAEIAGRLYDEKEALDELTQTWSDARDITGDVLKGLVDDARAGKDAVDILTGAFTRLENKLISLTEQKFLDFLFGTGTGVAGTGGLIASLLGLPARQHGGDVRAGRGYLVGERGPELFVPSSGGTIVPRPIGGTSISISAPVDARGSSMGRGEFDAILQRRNQQLLRQVRSGLPAMLVDAQDRGI